MRKLGLALFLAPCLLGGCIEAEHHRNRCEAPAVGVCAGCEASCRRDEQPSCAPGRSVQAQGSTAGYCSEQAVCRCRD
jgi:hypothetical protein